MYSFVINLVLLNTVELSIRFFKRLFMQEKILSQSYKLRNQLNIPFLKSIGRAVENLGAAND